MNVWQRKIKRNLNVFIRDSVDSIWAIPNKRNKLYKKIDGRLISHRAVVKVIRKLMKEKLKTIK